MWNLIRLLLSMIVFATASCSWQLRNSIVIPSQMKKMIFDSEDPNGPLSRAICNYLHFNDVELIEKDSLLQGIPTFRVLNFSLSRNVVSVFQNMYFTEYQIVLLVNAAILIPGKDLYPISTKVCRSFFDDPQTALAKDAEQQVIVREMYDKAAEQLIRKISTIQLTSKETNIGCPGLLSTSNFLQ